jgi:hypothetical protein
MVADAVAARAEIARLKASGYGPAAIARSLNARSIQTPSGRGRWHPDTIRRHLEPAPWAAYMRTYRSRHR